MKSRRWVVTRDSIMIGRRLTVAGLVLVTIVAAPVISGCIKAEPTQAPAPVEISMKLGERYHEIHTNKLQMKCDFCHTNMTETYYDPMAQVSNLADKRACLSCHKEGAAQPFYGEDWTKAKVR